MINATDTTAPRLHSEASACPSWCNVGDNCRGDHWGSGQMVSASLYSGQEDGRVELFLGAVQEDCTRSEPGFSLSIAQFDGDGCDENGMSAFLTVDELRQLVSAAQQVLTALEA